MSFPEAGVIKIFSGLGGIFILACLFAFLRNRGYLVRLGVRPADPAARELERRLHPHPYNRPVPRSRTWKEEVWVEMVPPELSEVVLKIKENNGEDQQREMENWTFASNLNLALTFLIVGPQEGETDLLDFSLDLGTIYIGAD